MKLTSRERQASHHRLAIGLLLHGTMSTKKVSIRKSLLQLKVFGRSRPANSNPKLQKQPCKYQGGASKDLRTPGVIHISAPSNTREHAFMQAAREGKLRVLRHILLSAKAQGKDQVLSLVNYQDHMTGTTPLAEACCSGNINVVRLLLANGADPYIYDNQNVSPLMKASSLGKEDIVKLLLKEGEADAFHLSNNQQTALMTASSCGSATCINTLLQVAQVEVRQCGESHGDHALLHAAQHGRLSALRALLAHSTAKVNQTDKDGNTALLLAARRGDAFMVQILLRHGAKHIPHFLSGRTPLMEAACEGHLQTVAALLPTMTDKQIQAVDASNRSALLLSGRPHVRALVKEYLEHSLSRQQQEQAQALHHA